MFFGFGGQKVSAAIVEEKSIKNWTWKGTDKCWNNTDQYKKSITFTISADMLTDGKFLADVAGHSKNGHTFMYFDAENELKAVLDSKKCYKDGDPVPVPDKMIFHIVDAMGENVSPPIEKHDFGALEIGSEYTLSCWGFANDGFSGEGGCSFGLEPSCNLSTVSPSELCSAAAAPVGIIPVGSSFKLCWTTANAANVAIDSGIKGSFAVTGSFAVPDGNIIIAPPISGINAYIMTVNGDVFSKTCQTAITVGQPSCIFSATPSAISYGNKTILKWETVGVTSATIDNGNSSTADDTGIKQSDLPKGSMSVAPLIDTTYTMTANGLIDPVDCPKAAVSVSAPSLQNAGLVPCGRLIDNLNTSEINESAPCDICSVFYMLKNIINFIMTMSIGVGIFILVIIGLLYVFSGGSLERISFAKTAINSVVSGISIIFIVWVAVAIILQLMGYGNMSRWNQVSCGLMATPSQVNNISIAVSDDHIVLSWSEPTVKTGISGYKVYRSSPTNAAYSLLTSGGCANLGNVLTCTDAGLTNGVTYYYKVLAVNAIGEGSQPSEISTMSDCSGADSNIYQSKTVAADTDQDGYSVAAPVRQCVGAPTTISGRTYYKNGNGNFYFIDSTSILGIGDCDESTTGADKWRLRYLDSDKDGYCTTPKDTPVCVGSDLKYPNYIDSCRCFTDPVKDITEIGSSACYYRDCASTDNSRWRNRYFDFDKDGYGDKNINIYGTDTATLDFGPIFCVGNHPDYVDNNTDCKPDNKNIYQFKNAVNDKDQDGHAITNKDENNKIIALNIIPQTKKDPIYGGYTVINKDAAGNIISLPSIPTDPELAPVCVGDSKIIKNTDGKDRMYYKNVLGNFEFIDSDQTPIPPALVSWLNKGGETDCDPDNVNIYQKKIVALDKDQDGYSDQAAAETKEQCVGDTKTVDGRIYYKNKDGNFYFIASSSIIKSAIIDCDPNNKNIYQLLNVATDADQDGYSSTAVSSQCVGDLRMIGGKKYYKIIAGSNDSDFKYIDEGSIKTGGVKTDCDDNNANIYQFKDAATDADHDGYSTTAASGAISNQCVGDFKITGGRKYYKKTISNKDSDFMYIDKDFIQPSGINTDCNDSDPAVHENLNYYCDGDSDGVKSKFVTTACVANIPSECSATHGTDCDDGNSAIKPGAAEICDGAIDNNCDGSYNAGVAPQICPGNCGINGSQICNGSGIWGACSTASSCSYVPICSPLSESKACIGGTETRTRSINCCGGCSEWGIWGSCVKK